jgi:hypothetical protein
MKLLMAIPASLLFVAVVAFGNKLSVRPGAFEDRQITENQVAKTVPDSLQTGLNKITP